VPIDQDLQQQLATQQRRVLDRWPDGTPVLFPQATANPDGRKPLNPSSYRNQLNRWLACCDIRDRPGPQGRPVHLTPHQLASHLRDPAGQPGRPPRGRPGPPRPRLAPNDRPVRQNP
jgi:hypothetical protein